MSEISATRFRATITREAGRYHWAVQDTWKPHRVLTGSNVTRPGAEDSVLRARWKLTRVWLRSLPSLPYRHSESSLSDGGAS